MLHFLPLNYIPTLKYVHFIQEFINDCVRFLSGFTDLAFSRAKKRVFFFTSLVKGNCEYVDLHAMKEYGGVKV
jgi:hypothetical protein